MALVLPVTLGRETVPVTLHAYGCINHGPVLLLSAIGDVPLLRHYIWVSTNASALNSVTSVSLTLWALGFRDRTGSDPSGTFSTPGLPFGRMIPKAVRLKHRFGNDPRTPSAFMPCRHSLLSQPCRPMLSPSTLQSSATGTALPIRFRGLSLQLQRLLCRLLGLHFLLPSGCGNAPSFPTSLYWTYRPSCRLSQTMSTSNLPPKVGPSRLKAPLAC
jgi:hypothetical protein